MTTVKVNAASDVHVLSTSPNSNFGSDAQLGVSNNTRAAYLWFSRPMPLGTRVISATLTLYLRKAAPAAATITAQAVATSWSESAVTWNARPAGTGSTTTGAIANGLAAGKPVTIDVTAIMQTVANGGGWHGIKLSSNIASAIYFYSRNGGGSLTPTLTVNYSDAPAASTHLTPGNMAYVGTTTPTLTWDYDDPQDDTLAYAQVQITSSATGATVWDSGQVAVTDPEMVVPASAGLSNAGGLYLWRVRSWDSTGSVSPWSIQVGFRVGALGAIALTAPTKPTADLLTTVSWTFTPAVAGDVQRSWRVQITDPDDPNDVWIDSGQQTSSATSWSPSPDQIVGVLGPGVTFGVTLMVWGSAARQTMPGVPTYARTRMTATITPTANSSISALAYGTDPLGYPFCQLTWTCPNSPSQFAIFRDGALIDVVDASDVAAADGVASHYAYTDTDIHHAVVHTWGVAELSAGSVAIPKTVTGVQQFVGVWLYDLSDKSTAAMIQTEVDGNGDDVQSFDGDEDSAIYTPLGSSVAVPITWSVRGARRTLTGTILAADLADWQAITAAGRVRAVGLKSVTESPIKVHLVNAVTGTRPEFAQGYIRVSVVAVPA